jgi:hypothetical protein
MMSLPQEAGKVATSVIDSLKTQPLSLALVVMNLALLAILYFGISTSQETRKHEFELMVNNQRDLRDAQKDIRQNMVPESEMRDVQRYLRVQMDDIKADLRACEDKINRKVDDTIKHNGGQKQ